ncbi:MAG: alanyl-tRNA editing protein AlaX [Desulfurococcaceae archaeon]|nr:MAG: alanyl-tRNA editing protein AlaX [Desulfurococcaceae archaeon]
MGPCLATIHLYRDDSYLREFRARVVSITDRGLVLDRTAFHPDSGGVSSDTGYLIIGGKNYRVLKAIHDRESDEVYHVLDSYEGISPGMEVVGVIDWDRRYRLMRLHTAAHIISAIMYRDYGAMITGGQVEPEYARDDFSIERFDRQVFEDAIRKANDVVRAGLEVKIYYLKREEAMKIPGIVKLAEKMPPGYEILRIVEIPGVDVQADGGPHVKNTSEIGEIKLLKVENRGKNKKRIYYTVP